MARAVQCFRGWIEDGKIRLHLREDFQDLLRKYEGQEIELILNKKRQQRSLNQNAYYWGVVVAFLAEHCGYELEEMHTALKERFLRDREHEVPGMTRIRSTSSLDTAEFTEYVENCRRLAAEMGVVIPDPT